jgi:anti-sigma factor RsiW
MPDELIHVTNRVDDYVDGVLSDADQAEVERHLRVCPDCRSAVEQTRSLVAAAGRLPPEVPPPADLWPGIASSLRPAAAPWVRLSLAAALVLAAGVATWWRFIGETPLLLKELERIEAGYTSAIGARRMAVARSGGLPPAGAHTIERNLRIIDDAITQTRAALQEDPGNTALLHVLVSVYEQKLQTLDQARSTTRGIPGS